MKQRFRLAVIREACMMQENPRVLHGFILSGLVLLLTSCAGIQDGPPANYTKQWHEIPDAVPEDVNPSKYGNPESYEVFGKRYYVMDEADGFSQKGIASWYGSKFHGRRTSSGEDYNMYAMTAAHKTLPIPVYVEVLNVDNGRKAVVRVNDRGPFHEGRIIDLSYAAATKLGVANTGTANVKIRVVTPEQKQNTVAKKQAVSKQAIAKPSVPQAGVVQGDKLYIQVAAFSTEKSARDYLDKLQEKGFFDVRVHVEGRQEKKSSPVYRVRIGPLPSEHVAKNVLSQLEENNYRNLKIVKTN
jgi:rare lipoprotein A